MRIGRNKEVDQQKIEKGKVIKGKEGERACWSAWGRETGREKESV